MVGVGGVGAESRPRHPQSLSHEILIFGRSKSGGAIAPQVTSDFAVSIVAAVSGTPRGVGADNQRPLYDGQCGSARTEVRLELLRTVFPQFPGSWSSGRTTQLRNETKDGMLVTRSCLELCNFGVSRSRASDSEAAHTGTRGISTFIPNHCFLQMQSSIISHQDSMMQPSVLCSFHSTKSVRCPNQAISLTPPSQRKSTRILRVKAANKTAGSLLRFSSRS